MAPTGRGVARMVRVCGCLWMCVYACVGGCVGVQSSTSHMTFSQSGRGEGGEVVFNMKGSHPPYSRRLKSTV